MGAAKAALTNLYASETRNASVLEELTLVVRTGQILESHQEPAGILMWFIRREAGGDLGPGFGTFGGGVVGSKLQLERNCPKAVPVVRQAKRSKKR